MTDKTIAQHYILQEELGVGGMGTVYKGLDSRTNQPVAIKQLKPEMATPDLIERFKREGEALRDLNHPNIVKMLDAVEEDGQHYLVMDYVSGGDLKSLITENGRLSYKQSVNIALDLSDALTRAHRLNIIHRDLKPANVLIAKDDTVRLTDFGVAHVAQKERVTKTDSVVGTVDYLSPESLNGKGADTRSDIWAFGILCFEMLTGIRPFEGDSVGEVVANILTKPLPDLEELCGDIPVALADLVYRMLEKDPQSRISSVRIIGAELEAILTGDVLDSRSIGSLMDIPAGRFVESTTDTTPTKHNLPIPPTPFVGRESELDALENLLGNNDTRLITILGLGGLGKTRLALETARRYATQNTHQQNFIHGIYFVPLAPIESGDFVMSTIADSVGFSFYSADNPKQQLLDYLREKSVLLVLDNFEHVISGASIVSDILSSAPDVKVIATSRERLNLRGETIFSIGGMDFPENGQPEDLLKYSCVKLFLQSAKRVQPDFDLLSNDFRDLGRILKLVQGVPLGIELAAAWVDALRLDEIAGEIQNNLDFLETDMRDTPERHRSIRAVFEYSWNLLAENERDLLSKLAVFRGGFSRDAAIAIADTSLRTLTTLVNKSLLSRSASGRYQVHELIRQYAEENLQKLGLKEEIESAHAKYFAETFGKLFPDFMGMASAEHTRLVEPDLDNLRTAWRWGVHHQDSRVIRSLIVTLHGYYQLRSLFHEGFEMAETALKAFEGREREPDVIDTVVELLLNSGWMGIRLGKFQYVKEGLERCIELLPLSNHPVGHFDPMSALGLIYSIFGDYDLATQYITQGLEFNTGRNDKMSSMQSYYLLTGATLGKGNIELAKQYCEQALAIAHEIKQEWFIAYIHIDRGHIARIMGRYDEARQHYHTSYTIRKDVFQDPEGMAVSLKHLARVSLLEGDIEQARNQYEESVGIYEDIGDRVGLITALTGFGMTLTTLGDFQKARENLHRALQLSQDTQLTSVILATLIGWGDLLLHVNQPDWGHEVLGIVLNHEISSQENKDDVNAIVKQHGDSNHPALKQNQDLALDIIVNKLLNASNEIF